MEFRRQEEGYNPPPLIRESAFTRPLPSLSSPPSLLSPRGGLTARNGVLPATPNPPPKDPDPVPAAAAPAGATTGGGGSIPKAVATTVAAAASEADAAVRYRECLRNHAASLGGHVLDGCGEFMPGGDAGTQEAMKCAACGCHRSFHRKEADRERSPFYRLPNGGHSRVPLLLPPPPPHHPQHHHHHHPHPHPHKHFPTCFPPSPPAIVASGGTTTESSSEERNAGVTTAATAAAGGAAVFAPPSKKRHRTKFTAEQKERMLGFAQSVGWRIQKQDEGEMERFCAEIGISRQVLKVWMHNNKHSIRRPPHQLEQHHQDQHQHQLQQQQP